MKVFLFYWVAVIVALAGCQSEDSTDNSPYSSASLADQVEHYNQNEEYEEALQLLRQSDGDPEEITQMQETVHLNYALYLTHERAMEDMTHYIPKALRHFRRVLEINPDNQQAQEQRDQIEQIYRQLGRDIPEGIAEQ